MKKIFITLALSLPLLANAASKTDYQFNPSQLIVNTMIVLLFYFAGSFILSLVKTRMEFQIKTRLLEKGVPDEVASQFLQPEEQDVKHQVFKWFLILIGISAGLALTYYTQPVGIHSAAIIVFCIALSFLAYYFFLKKTSR